MPLFRTHSSAITAALAVLALVLSANGCGSGGPASKPKGLAHGRVTFAGEPVTEGMVCLVDESTGNVSQSNLDSRGMYYVEAFTGNYKVIVTPPPPPSTMDINEVVQPKDPANIPRKYRSPATSELAAVVKEGNNELNLDLVPQKDEPPSKGAGPAAAIAGLTPSAPKPAAAAAPASPTAPSQAPQPPVAASAATSAPPWAGPIPIAAGVLAVVLLAGGGLLVARKKKPKAKPEEASEEQALEAEPVEGAEDAEPATLPVTESASPAEAEAVPVRAAARKPARRLKPAKKGVSAAKGPARTAPKNSEDALVDKYLFGLDDESDSAAETDEEFDPAGSGELLQDSVPEVPSTTESTTANMATEAETVDRRAARIVLGLGGKIRVTFDAEEAHEIEPEEDLPDEPFQLVAIYLEGNQEVTDEVCESFRGLSLLQILDLAATPVGDAGVKNFAQLTGLRELALAKTAITDIGLVSLREMSHLRRLLLRRTKITDAGLVHLQPLDRLELLELKYTDISDASIDTLAALAHLKQLFVGETKISDEGVARLQAAIPECKIVK